MTINTMLSNSSQQIRLVENQISTKTVTTSGNSSSNSSSSNSIYTIGSSGDDNILDSDSMSCEQLLLAIQEYYHDDDNEDNDGDDDDDDDNDDDDDDDNDDDNNNDNDGDNDDDDGDDGDNDDNNNETSPVEKEQHECHDYRAVLERQSQENVDNNSLMNTLYLKSAYVNNANANASVSANANANALLVRRFRRSSIGMQRKAAFRQKKLDSLGTWRRQRRTGATSNARRPIRIVPDWTENAIQGEHFWKPTSASGDLCCLNEECIKSGQRMKCSACQLIAHQNCIPIVNEKTQLACKPTYRDVGVRQYREQAVTHHHWVHRKMEKGKCKQCGKVRKSNALI
uniref:Phorbol-ester/DAG-type domain-containing protein n=1 Tax=Glossina palpalis gambiensis TaxID=67801 RepID=A0A1B0BIU6_9MUSC